VPEDPVSSDALDLYAKVEDLLGVKEAAPELYAYYFLSLGSVDFDSILDIGCGSGDFLYQIQNAFAPGRLLGIDLSPHMVKLANARGLDAELIDLCRVDGSYDVITAVFDMLNYLDKKALKRFLACVNERLNQGGLFLFDINTLFGFENVAVGSYIMDDEERFLAIDSEFEAGEYRSEFTLFEKEGECFRKSKELIRQFYHDPDEIAELSGLELLSKEEVTLYGFEEADKQFVVLQKR
jgi:predicted TPR repeat methyltransferase